MIRFVVAFTGTASPSPTPATAVLIPTTWPDESASAPPELPGFSAASVWITSSIIRAVVRPRAGMLRPRPLTTPAVTLPAKPERVPDRHHERAHPQRPGVAVRRPAGTARSARSTARSDSESRPTTSKRATVPSANAASPEVAWPTTCPFVIRWPSPLSTTADPVASPRSLRMRMDATRGVRVSATRTTTAE